MDDTPIVARNNLVISATALVGAYSVILGSDFFGPKETREGEFLGFAVHRTEKTEESAGWRKGFELRADGVLIPTGIGSTDRPLETQGKWKVDVGGRLALYSSPPAEPTKVMGISSVDKDRLVTKK